MKILLQYFLKIWMEAADRNRENILSLTEKNPQAKVADIGCGDGQVTIQYKVKIRSKEITGVDGVNGRLKAAKNRGVKIIGTNLEEKWPFKNEEYDVIISNQVIEHILDIDNFISEIYRILKPGGYCVISTENLASWHNIFALLLGYQDFSHTIIKKSHVGNPLSIHHGEKTGSWGAEDCSGVDDSAFPHIKIMTYKSLRVIFEEFGFTYETGKGSGYYPLFGFLSQWASRIDPYHSHFITVKMRKPK
jgi:ubiquinone/menaquinone biosynthesis C-methylase UbiE